MKFQRRELCLCYFASVSFMSRDTKLTMTVLLSLCWQLQSFAGMKVWMWGIKKFSVMWWMFLEKLLGVRKINMEELYEGQVRAIAGQSTNNDCHVLANCYEVLLSRHHYRTMKVKSRAQKTFILRSIHFSNLWHFQCVCVCVCVCLCTCIYVCRWVCAYA